MRTREIIMKKNIYKAILGLAIVIIIASCNREPVAPPEPVIDYVTIAQLRDMHTAGVLDTIKTNIYIQGVITLTPELGNLPSFVAYIQDSTDAICLTVSDATNTLAMDSEVKILCYGVPFTEYNGLLQFGEISIASQVEVVNITAELPDPDTVTIAQVLTGAYQGKYVYIPGVQFDAAGTFSGNKVLTDCTSQVDVYTRSAATFSGTTMPTGNGSLKGISSVYNDQQILLRDPAELDMTGDRCGVPSAIYLSQDFSTLTTSYTNVSALAGWLTCSEAGTKTWFSYKYNGNYFVETTAYNSGAESVITWMVAPQIDLADATSPYVSFDCADGFDNGATLQLYASTDFDGSDTPWDFTWEELTFTHPPSSASGYSAFTTSGQVNLSAYNGSTVYIAWKYTGSATNSKTTTYEVDNVVIAEK
jgi:hypothetical protein